MRIPRATFLTPVGLLAVLLSTLALDGAAGASTASQTSAPAASDTQARRNGDWPMFRGNPQLSGVATSQLPGNLTVRWRFTTGERIESSAAIVGDSVYVGCDDGRLYALSLADGKPRWTYAAIAPQPERATTSPASRKSSDEPSPIRSSPCMRDGVVYVGDDDGTLHAVDAATGTPRWTFSADDQIISSPNIDGERVLFGSYDAHLYCLTRRDGKLAWKYETNGRVHGTVGIADGHALVAGCDEDLHVVRIADGKQVRAVPMGGVSGTAAAISGSSVFVGTFANQVLGIDWSAGKVMWRYESQDRQFPFYASAAVAGSRVFAGGRDKNLYAFDAATGKLLWQFRANGRIDSSPVVCGNRVFFGSLDGVLYAIDIASGQEVWRFEAGDGIAASAAIGRGRLVIGTEGGTVYCFSG